MIKVLVVEDSAVVRELLVHILSSDPEIKVIGTAPNGEDALKASRETRPDVITMDIHMPQMNGFDATRRIMENDPTPIVIVGGSSDAKEIATTFRALEAGAVALIRRPAGPGHPEHETTAKELIQTVKLMSEVKVVKRWPRRRTEAVASPTSLATLPARSGEIQVVAIGASTGGPVVLQTILAGLPKAFPVPVLIVQHMAPGFIAGFVDWLTQSSRLPIHVAVHGEAILPAHVYVAPDDIQMGVKRGRIVLSRDAAEHGLRPAVSYLFRSVANTYGARAVGIILSGMGKDGAEELKLMKECGATTIAQDKETSIVHGMPGEAMRLDAVSYVLAPEKMPGALQNLLQGGPDIAASS